MCYSFLFFFFQAEDGIRDDLVTGVQTCALPILLAAAGAGVMTLVALGRRLTVTGSRPAPHALAGLHGPRRRPEVTELHGSPPARAERPRSCRGWSACRRARRPGACGAGRGPSPSAPAWARDRSSTSSA